MVHEFGALWLYGVLHSAYCKVLFLHVYTVAVKTEVEGSRADGRTDQRNTRSFD